MAFYPRLTGGGSGRTLTEYFAGYNHNLRIRDGEFFETQNLSLQHYPMLSSRPKRGRISGVAGAGGAVTPFTDLQAIIAKDALYWVDDGTLYANGNATGLTGLQTELPTQLVSMGAYICIFPDQKYINTMDLTDYGSMGADWSYEGDITYTMCHADGEYYTSVTQSAEPPESPSNGDIWVEMDGSAVHEYSVTMTTWVTLETVYTRLDFTTQGQAPAAFKEMDGVNVSGATQDDLNGSKIMYAVGQDGDSQKDFIVLVGICGPTHTDEDATMRITRKIPTMDYVCEAQNRLWGCFYGNDGTQNINELYCCALGDFRNWEQYLGISTDSWRASRGSDGPWTGCINYLGTPTFFKENVIHPIQVSTSGAHQVGDIPARGVQQGSNRSLCVVNETLYYKSRTGIMAYQGGMPAEVGQALGDEKYYEAAAGAFGQRYYISMKDAQNAWHLFCYDAGRGMWMHEDASHCEMFASMDDELYALCDNGITAINGTVGTLEEEISWSCTTGLMTYEYPDKKYIGRFNIRVNMPMNAKLRMYIEYDSSGNWMYAGEYRLPHTGTVNIPLRPRRCDHLRLRFEGSGDIRLYSIAKVVEKGSDM